MPRPQRCRRVCEEPKFDSFAPDGFTSVESVKLTVDEYEIIRLVDLEQHTHARAAEIMDISRTTATEIYNEARIKIADCIVNGKRLLVAGGNYRLCGGGVCNGFCPKQNQKHFCIKKGKNIMRIAVTYENGQIFQHFGHTAEFKFYDIENGQIVNEQIISTNGSGHGALAGFLSVNGAEILICGGIGGGAQNALVQAQIKLYGGVSGNADAAVKAFLNNELDFNPNVQCNHHNHEHGEGGHTCGSHGCGNHNCH